MESRRIILLLLVVRPGFLARAVCAYYLIPEWAALTASNQNYRARSEAQYASGTEISMTRTAQAIHRINCFAEAVGELLGGIIVSSGIHGVCMLRPETSRE